MARTYRTVNRIFAILTLLDNVPQGLSIKDIYQRLHSDHPADERTFRRDLENLEFLGFLFSFQDTASDTSAVRYKPNRSLPVVKSLVLDFRELFSLYVAQNLLFPLREAPFYQDVQRVFKKIEKLLGPKCLKHLALLASEIHFDPGPRWSLGIDAELLDVVERSCAEGHQFTVQYKSVNSGTHGKRRLGPHFLYFAKDSLYLVAEDFADHVVKVFALPRMSNAVMSEQEYSGTKVDPKSYFESAFTVFRGKKMERIELVFSPPYATTVLERRWHSSQKTTPGADGTVIMTLDVAITPELVQWVLGFGEGVRIKSPKALVKEILTAASTITGMYKKMKTTRE